MRKTPGRRIGVDYLSSYIQNKTYSLVLAVVLFCCLAALADEALRYVTHLLKLEAGNLS